MCSVCCIYEQHLVKHLAVTTDHWNPSVATTSGLFLTEKQNRKAYTRSWKSNLKKAKEADHERHILITNVYGHRLHLISFFISFNPLHP